MVECVYLLLGGNVGDRAGYLQLGVEAIRQLEVEIAGESGVYETAAWGKEDELPYLNVALELRTSMAPLALLRALQAIEHFLGREREKRWGARTLDIDILFWGDRVTNLPELTLPHPRLQERRFVLTPMAELAPGFMHPQLRKTMAELLAVCTDTLPVRRLGE